MVLLEGLKTGSAKVSVNLPYTEYRHVLPAEVNLMVVANLLIDPPDAYVLKGDTVKFRLLQVCFFGFRIKLSYGNVLG